ncbi:type IV pilus modification protein PilV [Paucibacter sp. TC2R-5]|uniref:type IV pilus modification protein PilV n=1 Tax=Paucibacter sp. TC2R-5 TaxID=2893555 RepID=UPI0021E425A2|nr:type IV pilus modification protein PilV [Paucibacter sp. TC2R-5]MCV2359498.1 type IV pilus modification protein PilV [Paucibacter sp. TC2R-5]
MTRKTPHQSSAAAGCSGFMLLEVLVALLIFALGVLGLVGLQANAVKQSGQAKYRADATLLANEMIGTMWVSNRSFAALTAGFGSAAGGAQYTAWKARVAAALPGAATYPPLVTIAQVNPLPALVGGGASAPAVGLTPSNRVTITLRWKSPSDPSGDPPSNLIVVTEIK